MRKKSINDLALVSEAQVFYKSKSKAVIEVKSSEKCFELFRPFFEEIIEYREFFYVMYLNRKNKLIHVQKISEGGCSGTVVDGKNIFQGALLANAQAIILCHNHPSGCTRPSESDITLTKKMRLIGEYMDMPVLDHLIISDDSYFSFADQGLM